MNDAAHAVGQPQKLSLHILVLALLPFGLGYFMSYLFRAVNAVVAPDLVREMGLNASQLGFLTAAYLLAFALFQLPLGILLDRYGPRRVQAALLIVAGAGAGLFAIAQDVVSLTIARGLIGLGFAGGLMSSLKAVVVWVPEQRRALVGAFVMSLGAVGLLVSTAPMEWAVGQFGWRQAMFFLAAITMIAAVLIFFIVPRDIGNGNPVGSSLKEQLQSVGRIYTDRIFLVLAPLLGLTAGTHIAIQTLWAGPWWRDVAGLDRAGVAQHLFLMALSFLFGILVTGAITDRFRRRGVSELDVMFVLLLLFMASQLLIIFDVVELRLIAWLVFGMSGQVAILAFPWLSSHFGTALSGRANTAMNLVIFGTAFFAQWFMGWIIDFFPRSAAGGYPREAYQVAFGLFVAMQALALLRFMIGRKHYAKA
jgi:MFS family permease